MEYTKAEIPVGDGMVVLPVPNMMPVVAPRHIPGIRNIREEICRAIKNPIGTPRLKELAKGKKDAAIVVNDITRPYPGGGMILEIADELHAGGMTDSQIFLVVAYGAHRFNTDSELRGMFGDEVVDRFRIVHHDAFDQERLMIMGETDGGVVVQVNKEFVEADLKILTGCIAPHQLAGFSGGRKSVVPGISGFDTLKAHHSFPIRPERTSLGWLEGNPFHEEAMKAARIAKVDFIVNSVDNEVHELIQCVAGDLTDAYMEGVKLCKTIWSVQVAHKPDVVIVSPGGYPRDFDLHQSQKAIGCAEMLCKDGGMIIMIAEMRDGIGKPGKVLLQADSPQDVIDRFYKTGYQPDALSKAFMWARALKNYKISILCSKVSDDILSDMFFEVFESFEKAIEKAIELYGTQASFMVVPYGSEIIPEFG